MQQYKIPIIYLILFIAMPFVVKGQSSDQNYIRTRVYTGTGSSNYIDKIDYYDGLGRLLQTNQVKAGGASQDLVSFVEYDAAGRQSQVWLPAEKSSNNGVYVTPTTLKDDSKSSNRNDSKPYSKTEYDALNRPVKEWGPGADWHSSDSKSVRTSYLTNKGSSDAELRCLRYTVKENSSTVSVSISSSASYYAVNELLVTKIQDEDNNLHYKFEDKQGRLLMTRQYSGGVYYNTYYIYDNYGNLRVVLPPLACDAFSSGTQTESSTNLKNYAYLYKYDNRNRCIAKKLPGADWIYYVYDKADRLILTQDGEQRLQGKWFFTIPDALGRTVLTGTCSNTVDYTANPLSSALVTATWANTTNTNKGYTFSGITLTSPALLTVNYYDQYDFLGKNSVPAISGFNNSAPSGYTTGGTTRKNGVLTGQITSVPGSTQLLYTVYHYDDRSRLIQTNKTNHLGGMDNEFIKYAFDGLPEKRYLRHKKTSTGTAQTEEYAYTYDHARRLTQTTHKNNGASTAEVLSAKTYDNLGRLGTEVQGGITEQQATYNYRDVRSRLTSTSRVRYNEAITYSPGGNILTHRSYSYYHNRYSTFHYDGLSRLTKMDFKSSSDDYYSPQNTAYTYDKHGNMTRIVRYGRKGQPGVYGLIDSITIALTGNQLKYANDAVANTAVTYAISQDFKNYKTSTSAEYTYNQNGAMTKDLNRGVSAITYNILNLPAQIDVVSPVAEARNTYLYSADGVKRQIIRRWNPSFSVNPTIGSSPQTTNLTRTETTDYVNNREYVDGTLKRINIDNGYIEGGVYYYYFKDYPGNNRMVITAPDTELQYINYYPFGMKLGDSQGTALQSRWFGDKEQDRAHGLAQYDFEARYYDPAVARFMMVDPLAEKYYSTSPYAYALNNPMRFTDPTGMWVEDSHSPDKIKGGTVSIRDQIFQRIRSLFSVNINFSSPETVRESSQQLEANAQTIEQTTEILNSTAEMMTMVLPYGSTVMATAKLAAGGELSGADGGYAMAEFIPGVGFAGKAAKGGKVVGKTVKTLSQFSKSSIDDAVNYAMKGAKVEHIFAPKHNLDPLVRKLGGQENVVRSVLNAANGKLPSNGVFNNIPVNVKGYTVYIRGSVNDGIPKLGTMYIP